MKTVSNIQYNLSKLEYDTPKDAEKVNNSRELMFKTLISMLDDSYNSKDQNIEEAKNEAKKFNIINQPDAKNLDIRSLNNDLYELYQLVIRTLAYSKKEDWLKTNTHCVIIFTLIFHGKLG